MSLFLWDLPIVYPIKLLIVLIHEINHVIMTVLTGGSVHKIIFSLELYGSTITSGGNEILIAASGYLGSLLVGLILFYSANNERLRNWVSTILSIIILIAAVNLIQGGLQIFLSLIFGLFFYAAPRYLPETVTTYIYQYIGLTSCLYIIADIKQDLLTTSLRETDTQILEYLTGFPAILLGIIWFIFSIILVALIIKSRYIK